MVTTPRVTDIDDVPVLFAPAPGPMRAGLVFRVGGVDETLATAGITHLVEHLALHRHGSAGYHYNGITAATTTQFVTKGTPETVVAFLNGVCASLRKLPVDRLAVEKKIVETETASQPSPVNRHMPLWRHGARDFGLPSYPQWGTHTVTQEQVLAWAASRFNRANAVLWIAGDGVPGDLRLDLPDGERWSLPEPSTALPVTPAYFTAAAPAIVLDALVPRSAPATLYARALERALFQELRHDRGLSYTASTAYSTDGRPEATITAVADARPEELDTVLDCFLERLHGLHEADIDPAELDAIHALQLEAFADPDIEVNLLPQRATDLLTGYPTPSTAQLAADIRETTTADIRKIAADVTGSALLMVPHTITRAPAGFEAAPTQSRFAVTGKRHHSRAHHRAAIVHGTDGVTLNTPSGPTTVLFQQCVAMLRYADGGRQLFGADGISVPVEPTLFRIPAATLASIDNAVPPTAVIDLPAREPASIPQPARLAGLRARLRTPYPLWRAHLDHFAFLSGGVGSYLLSLALAATMIVAIPLAIALDRPGFGAFGLMCGALLIVRWHRNGYW
jgi:hypothetical protein